MDKSSLVYPIFVIEGENIKEEIPTMPGQYRWSLDRLPEILTETADAGVGSVMLFGIPAHKDEVGSQAYACDGIIQKAMAKAKKEVPDLYYIGDVCMCEYTSHGHCGILKGDYVDNDLTLEKLAQIAVERGCGRLEWWCLDWNRPSIDFYLSLGAEPMSDWTVYRIAGDTLAALAKD